MAGPHRLTRHQASNTVQAHSLSPCNMVGLGRFELPTPRLSSVCSNQLSYRPVAASAVEHWADLHTRPTPVLSKLDRTIRTFATPGLTPRCHYAGTVPQRSRQSDRSEDSRNLTPLDFSRKEVIQPQVLLQLPCYDFTPITNHTLGAYLPCGLARRLLVQPAFVM